MCGDDGMAAYLRPSSVSRPLGVRFLSSLGAPAVSKPRRGPRSLLSLQHAQLVAFDAAPSFAFILARFRYLARL